MGISSKSILDRNVDSPAQPNQNNAMPTYSVYNACFIDDGAYIQYISIKPLSTSFRVDTLHKQTYPHPIYQRLEHQFFPMLINYEKRSIPPFFLEQKTK
jgi:hypothetical protein